MEQQDVYCFGHVLYEMTFGKELRAPTTDEIPPNCPPLLGKLIHDVKKSCSLSLKLNQLDSSCSKLFFLEVHQYYQMY
jgi:PX domain-containing protein kinase-like protein